MAWNVVVSILLTLLVGGCATPHRKQESQVAALKQHISLLEAESDRKDQEIERLEDKLERRREIPRRSDRQKKESRETSAQPLSIKQIQTALKSAGFYKGPIDGKMGPKTKEAVKAFQKANGLKADGVVGKKTWMKLAPYLD